MNRPLLLASGSATRLALLRAAGLEVTAHSPRIDEPAIRAALEQEAAGPRGIADTLAEMKARKIADRFPGSLVLGCDQVLDFEGRAWGKPETPADALTQLGLFRGKSHDLHSAVVLYDAGTPVWRHVGHAKMTMRNATDAWLRAYVDRNWEEIRHSAGAYQLESEGIRLFSAIEGDYFAILGLPMLPLLIYLGQRGFIDT